MSAAETAAPNSAASTPAAKPTGIILTPKAVKEVARLKAAEENTQNAALRVQVVGGGCSGMSYKLGFESEPAKPTDKVFEQDGVQVIVDSKSYLYLAGMTLDFTDGLNGQGFVFNNPNAKRSCGCGSSFSA
jgi:iron-sulfur cluster assembly protein